MEYPVYWTYNEWTEGFRRLLDYLQLDEVSVILLQNNDLNILVELQVIISRMLISSKGTMDQKNERFNYSKLE